jgi:hypothetical protein
MSGDYTENRFRNENSVKEESSGNNYRSDTRKVGAERESLRRGGFMPEGRLMDNKVGDSVETR